MPILRRIVRADRTRYALWCCGLLGLCMLVSNGCDQINPWAAAPEEAVASAASMPGKAPAAAPVWALQNLDGKTQRLEDLRGTVVLLNFWATWCPPCREEIPDLIRVHQAFAARGVTVVGLAVDDSGADAIKAFVAKYGITYPVVLGNIDIAQQYRVNGIPASFLIDRQGRIVKRWNGPRAEEAFTASIDALLQQEAQ